MQLVEVLLAESVQADLAPQLRGQLVSERSQEMRLGHAAGLQLEQRIGPLARGDRCHRAPQLCERDSRGVLKRRERVQQR